MSGNVLAKSRSKQLRRIGDASTSSNLPENGVPLRKAACGTIEIACNSEDERPHKAVGSSISINSEKLNALSMRIKFGRIVGPPKAPSFFALQETWRSLS